MMETDDALRARVLREWERRFGPPPGSLYVVIGHGLDAHATSLGMKRIAVSTSSDPFGDAIRSAQAREDVEPAIIPHPVARPETPAEIDHLWTVTMECGRGG